MIGERVKLFFDLEKAKQFGSEVEKIANEITVQTGKRTYQSIIRSMHNPDENYIEVGGHRYFGRKKDDINPLVATNYYHIDTEKGHRNQDVYYVRYFIARLHNASKADKLQAQRQADEYLNQKYQELGPDIGVSRA